MATKKREVEVEETEEVTETDSFNIPAMNGEEILAALKAKGKKPKDVTRTPFLRFEEIEDSYIFKCGKENKFTTTYNGEKKERIVRDVTVISQSDFMKGLMQGPSAKLDIKGNLRDWNRRAKEGGTYLIVYKGRGESKNGGQPPYVFSIQELS